MAFSESWTRFDRSSSALTCEDIPISLFTDTDKAWTIFKCQPVWENAPLIYRLVIKIAAHS